MAKALKILFIISLLTLTSLLPIFSAPAHAESNTGGWPESPGTVVLGKDWNSSRADPVKVEFTENDAYESGWASEPYQFKTAIWNDEKNQRVTVDVYIENGILESTNNPVGSSTYYHQWDDKNGYHFAPDNYEKDNMTRAIQARMYQDISWVSGVNLTQNGDTGWVNASMAEITQAGNDKYTFHARFTFLTSTADFTNGLFRISIIVHVHWTTFIWFGQNSRWEKLADIYGQFTWGDIQQDQIPTPDATDKGYTHTSGTVYAGKWHIEFWYAGQNGDWHITKNGVTNDEGTAKMMKDFGYFDLSNPHYNLTYYFNESDPSGLYLWVFYSVYTNGEVLYYFAPAVHNNAKSLVKPDGSPNQPPSIQIWVKNKPIINQKLEIQINVTDDNTFPVKVWLIAYYGSQILLMPAMRTNLSYMFFNYPLIFTQNGSKVINATVRNDGQLVIFAYGHDSNNNSNNPAMNQTWIAVTIQGFSGGAGWGGDTPAWLMFPWQSTTNLIIMLVGIILLLSGKSTLRLIGIALFFASFINWPHVFAMIQAGLNPVHWLNMWRWWR